MITPQSHIELTIRNNITLPPKFSVRKLKRAIDNILVHIGYERYKKAIESPEDDIADISKEVLFLYATRNNTEEEKKILNNLYL